MLDPATRNRLRSLRDALDTYERTGNPTYRDFAERCFAEFSKAAIAAESKARADADARHADVLAGLKSLNGPDYKLDSEGRPVDVYSGEPLDL